MSIAGSRSSAILLTSRNSSLGKNGVFSETDDWRATTLNGQPSFVVNTETGYVYSLNRPLRSSVILFLKKIGMFYPIVFPFRAFYFYSCIYVFFVDNIFVFLQTRK